MLTQAPDASEPAGLDTDLSSFHQPEVARSRHLPVGESVTRGALTLLSTQPLTWGGSLLTTVVAPRLLGAEALGQLAIVATIASIAGVATTLGIGEYLVRRIAQRPATLQQDVGVAFVVQTTATVLGALAIVLIAPLGVFPDPRALLLYVTLLGMLVLPVQTVLASSFRGREMHVHYAWFNAMSAVLGQVGGVIALFLGAGVFVYAAINVVATVAVTLAGWQLARLRPVFPAPNRASLEQVRELIVGGFPFWTSALALTITSGVDRILLGWFVPAAEVGWYAAAYRVCVIPIFIPTLILTPLFPALSRVSRERETVRKMITRTMRVIMLLMVPLSAGTVVVAPIIPNVLGWPADFDNAHSIMAILAIQLPVVAVDMLLGVVLIAIGCQGPWVTVGIIVTALKIGADYLAIPLFETLAGNGAVGASIVTLVSELIMFGGAMLLIPRHLLDPQIAKDSLRIMLAGLATYGAGAVLLPVSPILAVTSGAAAYVGVSMSLHVLSVEDCRALGEVMLSRVRSARR